MGEIHIKNGCARCHIHRMKFGGEENAAIRTDIRWKWSEGVPYRQLAKEYNCSLRTIENVVKKRGNYARF